MWSGRTVFVIGGGPSLTGFDFERLRGKGTILAVNDAAKAVPFADALLSIDTVWWRNRARLLQSFRGEKIAIVPPSHPTEPDVTRYGRDSRAALSRDPQAVCTGENSGFAAVGLSIMRGANLIYLLGFDMTGPGHFHGGYEWHCRYGANDYPRWSQLFGVLQHEAQIRGVSVINLNPDSAIRCFRIQTIDGVLNNG